MQLLGTLSKWIFRGGGNNFAKVNLYYDMQENALLNQ